MTDRDTHEEFTMDLASVLPVVDEDTTGQYGAGLGSEDEERQLDLLVTALEKRDSHYQEIKREVPYPARSGRCDLVLPSGIPVEAKLLRYWRANGDPEPAMYGHVFSPFHQNTLLTDANRLHDSAFSTPCGLLGLFYTRADDDPQSVTGLPERYTAPDIAEKVVQDINHWYEATASICTIAPFDDLQHTVHTEGAVISWLIE